LILGHHHTFLQALPCTAYRASCICRANRAVCRFGLPAVDFAVGFGDTNAVLRSDDGSQSLPKALCPLLTFAKRAEFFNILIPSGEFVKKVSGQRRRRAGAEVDHWGRQAGGQAGRQAGGQAGRQAGRWAAQALKLTSPEPCMHLADTSPCTPACHQPPPFPFPHARTSLCLPLCLLCLDPALAPCLPPVPSRCTMSLWSAC